MPAEIFLCYRRDDSAAWAGRISEHLGQAFGTDCVFMDVEGIPAGRDFVKLLDRRISDAEVVLAIIGPAWVTVANADGKTRLQDENDFVRIELESALKLGKTVIPVLVGAAKMPNRDALPNSLKSLSNLNAISISHEKFPTDMVSLVKVTRNAASQQAGENALNAGFGAWVLNSLGRVGSLIAGTLLGAVVGLICTLLVAAAWDSEGQWLLVVLGSTLGIIGFIVFASLFWRNFSLFPRNRQLFNFLFGLTSGVVLVPTALFALLFVVPAYYFFSYKVERS
jgi:TIR domain